jgi:hypothetical protein
MTRPTDERPPPEHRERATQEQAENGSCTLLRHPKTPLQPSEHTDVRAWVGATWFVLVVETQKGNARGLTIKHDHARWRIKDVEEMVRLCRTVGERQAVEVRLTPEGRACGTGIKLAYELMQRGIVVSLNPLDERTARLHESELKWADADDGEAFAALSSRRLPDWMPDHR